MRWSSIRLTTIPREIASVRRLHVRSPLHGCCPATVADCGIRQLEAIQGLRVQTLRDRRAPGPAADPLKLPDSPNSTAGADPFALWKAPGHWLVYSELLSADALESWVSSATLSAPLLVTDATSESALLELTGTRAIDVLLRDCTLDLEGGAVPVRGCAQTQFAQTSVIIHRPTHDAWRMFVERSVALHVWNWIIDSMNALGRSDRL